MEKRNSKHEKRVRKLIVACTLCAIILTVSTYAWFVGMQTVNVQSFDVNIATTEGLTLSLNGEDWSEELTVNSTNYSSASYDDNTNSWGTGLIPMSTVGKISTTTSRMILYEKGSLTASPGGYRLMASQVDNTTDEHKGYVVFDLFIRNLSGDEYYPSLTTANEEAIYLTPESTVKVGSTGADGSGIENSVRVAFAQIGRVKSDAEVATVTGITCTSNSDVVGICENRDAQIWEPNDKEHVQNAINWYTKSCKARSGEDVTDPDSFSGTCSAVVNGTAYDTYSVSGEILDTDNVDVYDGDDYNGYTDSKTTEAAAGKLMVVDTFTDSEKNLRGTDRLEFMSLAPNSITKVRVYIYIEGQDIDNYDFAQLGKQISVSFGFTKEKFNGEDVNYDQNPELPEGVYSSEYVE